MDRNIIPAGREILANLDPQGRPTTGHASALAALTRKGALRLRADDTAPATGPQRYEITEQALREGLTYVPDPIHYAAVPNVGGTVRCTGEPVTTATFRSDNTTGVTCQDCIDHLTVETTDGQRFGVFEDGLCVYIADSRAEGEEELTNRRSDIPALEYQLWEMCPEHVDDEQPRHDCEECARDSAGADTLDRSHQAKLPDGRPLTGTMVELMRRAALHRQKLAPYHFPTVVTGALVDAGYLTPGDRRHYLTRAGHEAVQAALPGVQLGLDTQTMADVLGRVGSNLPEALELRAEQIIRLHYPNPQHRSTDLLEVPGVWVYRWVCLDGRCDTSERVDDPNTARFNAEVHAADVNVCIAARASK